LVALKLEPPSENAQAPAREIVLRTLNAEDATETVLVDVSTKPMIGLVWLGALLYTAGGLIAYRRRASEMGILGEVQTTGNEAHPAAVLDGKKRPAKSGGKPHPVSAKG
jgi:hypothetical protein